MFSVKMKRSFTFAILLLVLLALAWSCSAASGSKEKPTRPPRRTRAGNITPGPLATETPAPEAPSPPPPPPSAADAETAEAAEAAAEALRRTWRTKEDVDAWIQWLQSTGMPQSKLVWNYDLGGVLTLENITAEEPLLQMPAAALFSRKQMEEGELKGCTESGTGLKAMTCLKLFLLHEKFNPTSFWAPHIKMLPPAYPEMLVHWTDEELSEIQFVNIKAAVAARREELKTEYALVSKYIEAHPELFPDPTNYTYDQWLWASFTFQTRALVDPRYRDQLSYVMVPLFDMLDHSSIIAVEDKTRYVWEVNDPLKTFTVKLNREVTKGVHPYISYGKLNNLELLTFYGFVLADNAAEYVNLGIPYQFREDLPADIKNHVRALISNLKLNPDQITFSRSLRDFDAVLAALRLAQLSEHEYHRLMTANITFPTFISLENELSVARRVIYLASSFLSSFPTTLAADTEMWAKSDIKGPNHGRALLVRGMAKETLELVQQRMRGKWLELLTANFAPVQTPSAETKN